MITIWRRLKNLWKLSEYNPRYDVETVNGTLTIQDKITLEKPTWFAHDPEGAVITPDNSDLFDKTDTLKELLGEQ